MMVETHLLRCWRHSVLGAWLAVAYALAVLASGLAPAAAHAVLDGAVLCSGLTLPGQDTPEPASELQHCKGCPVNPVLAGPSQDASVTLARVSVAAVAGTIHASVDAPAPKPGLPPSHAPPGALPRHL